jgi:hypothetical protein
MNTEEQVKLRNMMLELGAVVDKHHGDKPLVMFVAVAEADQVYTTYGINASDDSGVIPLETSEDMASAVLQEIIRFKAAAIGAAGSAERVTKDALAKIILASFQATGGRN